MLQDFRQNHYAIKFVTAYNALFDLETLEIIEGYLPNRATKMFIEWASIYQGEYEIWINGSIE